MERTDISIARFADHAEQVVKGCSRLVRPT